MASWWNAKGTTQTSFKIGKTGNFASTMALEYVWYSGIVGTASTATTTVYGTTQQVNTISALGSLSHNSTGGFVFTSSVTGLVIASWWADNATGARHYAGWGRNLNGTENIYNNFSNSTNTVTVFGISVMPAGVGETFGGTGTVIPVVNGTTIRPMVQSSGNVPGNGNCGGIALAILRTA